LDGQIIGSMALTDGWIGYMFARDTWGHGFASEAARAILDYGFTTLGLSEAKAGTYDGNKPSENVLRKLGFQPSGPSWSACKAQNTELPGQDWRLTRQDYLSHDPIFVKTNRLTLRNLTAKDAPRYHQIVTHPKVGPMLVIFPPDWSLDAAAAHINDARYDLALKFRLGIFHGENLIGAIGCSAGDTPAIYYYFHPDTHGQGFASEIVPAFCDMLFARFPIKAIKAGVFTDNPASAKVLTKAGFQPTDISTWKSEARASEAEVQNDLRQRT
ncbi:MAG: GNAT family N-acetyltransferase, partial [Deltaproteobacteria bacterium]